MHESTPISVDDDHASLNPDQPAEQWRTPEGWQGRALFGLCVTYTAFHLVTLNLFPLETWTFRILHIFGGLVIGFAIAPAHGASPQPLLPAVGRMLRNKLGERLTQILPIAPIVLSSASLILILAACFFSQIGVESHSIPFLFSGFALLLVASTLITIPTAWRLAFRPQALDWASWVLMANSVAVAAYLLLNLGALQYRAGVLPTLPDFAVAFTAILLILELTRRTAGLALVIISLVFILYGFVGEFLPAFLQHSGYQADRFFTYLITQNGILGPTTAVSSTYLVLFVTFAAFLQVTRVGDYFVKLAFAAAGHARGGPAKVAIFASALMGMINGSSAGNVVATGTFTIPLMKRVGYRARIAGAIEAVASTGGQLMPPVMGAGAFLMAEITGIPYTQLIVAAIIPAVLYFISIYFMVDLEAVKTGLSGMPRSELPAFKPLFKQIYLLLPVVILVSVLFMGYSVIRAGTLAMLSVVAVSWGGPYRMGIRRILSAFAQATKMLIQLVSVCACAGIIVGVIGLTGVGLRFSTLLLSLAETSQGLALLMAMAIALLLGLGMPTTAAYAVAASVVAPGLVQIGISPLVAHFFVFYFAVISAITPPVALAGYAGAAVAGANPLQTSLAASKLGIAAYIAPFMFFYSPSLLMVGDWPDIVRSALFAMIGVYLLTIAVQGWWVRPMNHVTRGGAAIAALLMIPGHGLTSIAGLGLAASIWLWLARDARDRVS